MELARQPAQTSTQTASHPKRPWFEPVALALLSLATVGTAWCSYQAAAWGGAAQGAMNQCTALSRQAAKNELQASQMALLDVLLFSQYLNAQANSNRSLAQFYADRFRGEAKQAFEAWMATKPYENPNAPPHPFVESLYQPRLREEARLAEDEGQRFWEKAGAAGRVSRTYILVTVLLASTLFCGGAASKFEQVWVRKGVLIIGMAALIFAIERLWALPVQF